jgi:hypothetical protein
VPRADYRCPACGVIQEDVVFSMAIGAAASAPDCPQCQFQLGRRRRVTMVPVPAANFDLKTDGQGDRGFQKFSIHRQVPTRNGLVQQEEVIDSLHKLRQVEKDSEQRYANGEGEPLRFRGYAQNSSNMDVGSFGTAGSIGGRAYDSGRAPTKKMPVTRHGTKKPTVAVAKGGGVTALKG